MSVCRGCDTELPPPTSGRPRVWCSERCRKAQYAGTCIDCGATLSGDKGRGPNAPVRCVTCNGRHVCTLRLVWTRDLVLERIREWADLYGEPPAVADWNPHHAHELHDEARARRFEDADGHWPSFKTLYRLFESWNAAIEAAGFEPRARSGGGGNSARRRSLRERAVA